MPTDSSLPKPIAVAIVLFVLFLFGRLIVPTEDDEQQPPQPQTIAELQNGLPADQTDDEQEASPALSPPGSSLEDKNEAMRDFPIDPSEAAILRTLSKPLTLSLVKTPMKDLLDYLEAELGVELFVDETALEEEGIDLDEPVSLQVTDHSARSVLGMVLEPLHLHWIIRKDVLWITTEIVAEEILQTRIYDVSDLVDPYGGDGVLLQELIQNATTGPWIEVDGEGGTVSEFASSGVHMLVIRQHWKMHEELRTLLTDLRKTRDRSTARKISPTTSGRQTIQNNQISSTSPGRSSPTRFQNPGGGFSPDSAVENALLGKVVEGNTQFAFDLFSKLRQAKNRNLFFSPYSISTALAMASAGARGRTDDEIARVMHFSPDQQQRHRNFEILQTLLNGGQQRRPYELRVANRLWGQQGFPILDPFLNVTRDQYHAEMALVNFAESEAVRQEINRWVEEQTDFKIRNIIPRDFLNSMTRLVLVNAIYFHGKWSKPFLRKNTQPADFNTGNKTVKVPMMFAEESCKYGVIDGVQVLEKSYMGGDVSMVILLPGREPDALDRLEASLNGKNFDHWLSTLHPRTVTIFLPRFKFESAFRLAGQLGQMGMSSAFDPSCADFSGISGQKGDPVLMEVFHKSYIDVDESGTTAAAATGGVGSGGGPAPRNPVFRADHPFLFLIRDTRTNSILFLGRVVNPKTSSPN